MKLKSLFFGVAYSFSTMIGQAAVIVEVASSPIQFYWGDERVKIDLNGDGQNDFRFGGAHRLASTMITERFNRYLGVAAIFPNSGGLPARLSDNTIIGGDSNPDDLVFLSSNSVTGYTDPSDPEPPSTELWLCDTSGCSGYFYPYGGHELIRGLIGVQFESDEGMHYGYIDVETRGSFLEMYINGWGYETRPDTPIIGQFVPEPSSVMCLALGLIGLGARRSRTE